MLVRAERNAFYKALWDRNVSTEPAFNATRAPTKAVPTPMHPSAGMILFAEAVNWANASVKMPYASMDNASAVTPAIPIHAPMGSLSATMATANVECASIPTNALASASVAGVKHATRSPMQAVSDKETDPFVP